MDRVNNNILLVYPEARAGSVGGMTKKTFIRNRAAADSETQSQ
jgi:hypothetical protein